jgi:hypothetical protein
MGHLASKFEETSHATFKYWFPSGRSCARMRIVRTAYIASRRRPPADRDRG